MVNGHRPLVRACSKLLRLRFAAECHSLNLMANTWETVLMTSGPAWSQRVTGWAKLWKMFAGCCLPSRKQ